MGRWLALDRLRALAVLLMVQGHTFTALMKPGELPSGVERIHKLIHGLTAPMFLLGAGMAFAITSYPRYATQRLDPAVFRSRMQRCLLLLVIGYGLQLPGGSLLAAFRAEGPRLAMVLRVGPLHLIALTLFISQLLTRVLPSARLHAATITGLGLLVSLGTPAVWKSATSEVWGMGLGSWLDSRYGSNFPVFPWASFVMFGVGLGGLLAVGRRPKGATFALAGGALCAATYALYSLQWVDVSPEWFWHTSPCYVAFRIGLVLLFLALFHVGENDPKAQANSGRSLTAVLTRHSLAAYVVHLLVLYGTPLTPNIVHRVGRTLSLAEASSVFVGVMLLTLLVAAALDLRRRMSQVQRARRVEPEREPAELLAAEGIASE